MIPDLIDFTKTFFAKHTILNILTKYCIFTSEDMLMVMRPYQITATERILNRIEIANIIKSMAVLKVEVISGIPQDQEKHSLLLRQQDWRQNCRILIKYCSWLIVRIWITRP